MRRGGVSFSIDTVRDYRHRFPEAELFYLIGADHVATLPAWRQAEELAGLVEFVVTPRPGQPPIPLPPPFRGRHLAGFPMDICSSQIRSRVKAGLTIQELVPDAVAEAIDAGVKLLVVIAEKIPTADGAHIYAYAKKHDADQDLSCRPSASSQGLGGHAGQARQCRGH